MVLANRKHDGLQEIFIVKIRLWKRIVVAHLRILGRDHRQRGLRTAQRAGQIFQRATLLLGWCTIHFRRLHKVVEVAHRMACRRIHTRMGLCRCIRRIFVDEAPKRGFVLSIGHRRNVEQHGIRHHHIGLWHITTVDVPHWIVQLRLDVLRMIRPKLLVILIHCLWDHIKVHPLRRLRLLVHEVRETLCGGIGQPLVNGHAVARRLGNLLSVLVQEQLV
mmetsp:Transcript_18960/g.31128  ORF Transcript_18960/g.31128 Transcript_18960/m.31128 type:complete len:219 (+) Transcript_18960:236-892(+)